MKRLHFSLSLLLLACGSISDPNKGANGPKIATVSGALTGTSVPSGAHVTLVWRTNATKGGPQWAVGDDVEVVNGKFSIALSAPPSSYLSDVDESRVALPVPEATGSDGTAGNSGSFSPPSTSSGGSMNVQTQLTPRDTVSGGITDPLKAAVAGFVVYIDKNGNGKLDLIGDYADSKDDIIGGNNELYLTFLSGGGKLDYEKLRDQSGLLPKEGYNLTWTEKDRWLPLDEVELKIKSDTKLPYSVCDSYSGFSDAPASNSSSSDSTANQKAPEPPTIYDGGPAPDAGDKPKDVYPSPDEVDCADDGYTWYAKKSDYANCTPTPQPPLPTGLCAIDYAYPVSGTCSGVSGQSIPRGSMPPEGWPCPIGIDSQDGGPATDASVPQP